jgi:PAS domain S-box-containing protein
VAFHDESENGAQGFAGNPVGDSLSEILDVTPDAMVVVNREGRIVLANDQAARLLGYKRADFLGLYVEQLVPERFRAGHRHRRLTYFQNPAARPMGEGRELCALRKDETELPVEISLTPIQTGNGPLVSAAVRDVSDRRRVERELRSLAQQQAEVARLGQLALSGSDVGPLMDEAAAMVARTLEVEYSKILELLPDGEDLLLRAGVGWRQGYVGHAIVGAGADSQAGYTLSSHEPVVVEDLRTERRFGGAPPCPPSKGSSAASAW